MGTEQSVAIGHRAQSNTMASRSSHTTGPSPSPSACSPFCLCLLHLFTRFMPLFYYISVFLGIPLDKILDQTIILEEILTHSELPNSVTVQLLISLHLFVGFVSVCVLVYSFLLFLPSPFGMRKSLSSHP